MGKRVGNIIVFLAGLLVLVNIYRVTDLTVYANDPGSDVVSVSQDDLLPEDDEIVPDTEEASDTEDTVSGNVIKSGANGEYATLADAFRAVSGTSDQYTFDIGDSHTENKALKLPKGNMSITVTGGVLNLKSANIAVNCDLTVDCMLSSLTKKNPAIKVADGKSLVISKEQKNLSTISGRKMSVLTAEVPVYADNVKNFASVKAESLSVNKLFSGIGSLDGSVSIGTKADITDIGTAILYVNASNAPKTNISEISGMLGICYADGSIIDSGTHLFNYKGSRDISENVEIVNTDKSGNILTAYTYGTKVKAEFPETVYLFVWEGGDKDKREGEWKEQAYYPSLEKAFTAMKAGGIYRVELNTDTCIEKLVIPSGIEELDIVGMGGQNILDCGKIKNVKMQCNVTLRNISLVSGGKPVKLSSGRYWIDIENVVLGGVSTSNWLRLDGDCTVDGNISVHGIYAVKEAELRFQKLSVQKGGIMDFSKAVTLAVVDKNGNYVKYASGDRIKAVKKFAGYFDDTLILINDKNCPEAKIRQQGSKLFVVK